MNGRAGNCAWIRAEGGEGRSIIYYDKDGNRLIRYLDPDAKDPPRGTKSWRHQNPGNIVSGSFARSHGSIGFASYPNPKDPSKKSHFAIFPDYSTGRKAMAVLLKTSNYIDLTLNEFPRRYTGILLSTEPDTKEVKDYRESLRKISRFDMERKIDSFEEKEYEKLLDAIQRCEGWYPGDEKFFPVNKIIGVRFVQRKPVEFLVQGFDGVKSWLTRAQAILLAEEKSLMVVVVHSHRGTYLRSLPHHTKFRNMMIS